MATEVLRRGNGSWKFRILDGTPTTPKAVVIPFIQSFTGELRTPRPASIVRLDGGVINDYAHVISGNDEFLAQGVQHTLTFWLEIKGAKAFLQAMSNTLEETITTNTWVVGAGTFLKANGTGGQIYNGAGTLVNPISHADPRHMRVHLECLHVSNVGGSNFGFRMEEVWFESVNPTYNETEVSVQAGIRRFGKLSVITAFTTISDLTPAP